MSKLGPFIVTDTKGNTRTVKHRGTLQMLINAGEVNAWEQEINLGAMSRDELREFASERGIVGRSKMNKAELITALEDDARIQKLLR